ncbi:TPA: hypothetical protein QDZ84_002885 [Shewanella algae]|uniref:hypothetical protein n=1 Tax=Shewanella algae TaxID=38313 RepID=UPI001C576A37|nr:hypothetical protein [Shewanella algae]HDS1207858.1 hypothetical protein [Shewanella algae]
MPLVQSHISSELFFQSLAIDGKEQGVSMLAEGTYIERMNLTGPKLMLRCNDPHKFLQDQAGLKNGSLIELGIGDAEGRGDVLFKESFIVGSNWGEGDQLCVEALQADIHRIKQPVKAPAFFIDKNPQQILSEIFPGYELVIDRGFEGKWTYHCLPGSTLSVMLERLRADYGAAIWLSRGKLYVKQLSWLESQEDAHKFEYMRPHSNNPRIEGYHRYHPNRSVAREVFRDYVCWDLQKGMIKMGNDYPPSFLSHSQKPFLGPRNLAPVNVMDCHLAGDGRFAPGMMIKLELNQLIPDAIFDESVPYRQLILGARHWQQGTKYITVCEMGEILDGTSQ